MKILTTAALAVMPAGLASAQTVNFDNLQPGAPPPGWAATQTGSGQAKPSQPNVLKQSGAPAIARLAGQEQEEFSHG